MYVLSISMCICNVYIVNSSRLKSKIDKYITYMRYTITTSNNVNDINNNKYKYIYYNSIENKQMDLRFICINDTIIYYRHKISMPMTVEKWRICEKRERARLIG